MNEASLVIILNHGRTSLWSEYGKVEHSTTDCRVFKMFSGSCRVSVVGETIIHFEPWRDEHRIL